MLNRRTLLVAAPVLAAGSALADGGEAELQAYERATGGRIGVYARNLASGATIAWRAGERFVMCSTFKASLAACVLARVDRGEEHLERLIAFGPGDLMEYAPAARDNLAKGSMTVGRMCEGAVELSDNTCANLLLARIGGPAALTAFWRSTGDAVSRLEHNEPVLNRSKPGDPDDTTTPEAMAGNLRRFVLGAVLSPVSRERMKGWLLGSKTGANRLREGLPAGWAVGDKTGNNGADAAGDIAIAWPRPDRPVLICAYTQGGTTTAARLEAVFTAVGQMVGRRLA